MGNCAKLYGKKRMEQDLAMGKRIVPLGGKQFLSRKEKEGNKEERERREEGKLRSQDQIFFLGSTLLKEVILSDADGRPCFTWSTVGTTSIQTQPF